MCRTCMHAPYHRQTAVIDWCSLQPILDQKARDPDRADPGLCARLCCGGDWINSSFPRRFPQTAGKESR